MSYQYILIFGDIIQGFQFNGPYATREDAEIAAGDSSPVTIARLWAPLLPQTAQYDAD